MHPDTVNGQLFQGTIAGGTPQLFPSASLLSDKARYPKGFTPERLRAVRAAGSGIDPRKDHPERAAASAAVSETIAASTVPIDHISGRAPAGVSFYVGPRVLPNSTALGEYSHSYGRGSIQIRPGQERTATVIHEIGHHVSALHEQTEHSAYDEPTHQGQEEAYAENYADTHFRDRRGRPIDSPRKSGNGTEWTQEGARGGPYGGFGPAFSKKRDESPVVQAGLLRRAAATDRMMRPIPPGTKNHVHGQERFLDRTAVQTGTDRFGSRIEQPEWNYVHRYNAESDPNFDPVQEKLAQERSKKIHG